MKMSLRPLGSFFAAVVALPILLYSPRADAVFPHGSCRGWASIAGWGGAVHAYAEAYLEQQQGSEWTHVETDTTEFWQGEAGQFLLGGRFEGAHPAGTYRVKLLVLYYGNAWSPLTQAERESWPVEGILPQWDHSVTFTCGANGPMVTSTPIDSAYVGVPYTYDAAADGAYCFEGLQGPSGMTIHPTTGLVEWTPQTSEMPRRVGIFRAVNSLGIGDVQGFMVNVSNGANLPPQIVSSPPSTGTEGVAYSYQAQSVDAAGDTATWSLQAAPTGMTIGASTGLVSWTPGAGQAGNQAVTVRVTDSGGLFHDQAYSITVTASGNQAPTFVSSPVLIGTEDEPYAYTSQATDDAGPVTYSLSYAPLGMSINPSSGAVTWLPRNFHVGTISVVVRATDPAGLFTSQPFDIVVSNANGPPRIVTHAPTVASVGGPYSYDVDAVDVDLNDTLTYSLTSAPSGMTINPSTGLLSFTPTSPQIGPHTATVRVEDAAGLSDLQTFTVHVRSVGPPTSSFRVAKGRNVSLPADGASVVAFSSQTGVFVASGALSLSGLSWVADNSPAPYLVVDLVGDQQVIDRVFLQGSATSEGVRDFEVQVSTTTADPGAFTTVVEGTVPSSGLRTGFDFSPTLARYVRLNVVNNHGHSSVTRLTSLEVYSQDTQGGVVSLLEGGATVVSATNNLAEAGQAINFADGAWRTTAGAPQSMVVELSSVGPVDHLRLRGGGNDACNLRAFELWLSATDTTPSSFVLAATGEVPNDGLEHWLSFPPTQARYAELRATTTHGATNCVQVRGMRLYSRGRGGPVVAFDNLSTDPDPDGIALYTWSFGDGAQSYERFPTHVYQASGTYHVELTVMDPGGLSHSEVQSYTVLAPPRADFTWSPLLPLEGSSPQFTDRSTPSPGTVILGHRYSVGGVTYAVPGPTFTLTDSGHLLVELEVTDSQLLTSRRTHQVEVRNAAPSPAAGSDRTVFWGETVAMGSSILEPAFGDRSSLQCVWNFGDGQSQSINNCFSTIGVTHAYASPGQYRARVSVLDKDGGEGSDGLSVQVVRRDLGVVVGPALSESGGNVTVQARLIDRFSPGATVAGRSLTFRRGLEQATATTDAAGVATAVLSFAGNTVNVVEVVFAGDGYYNSAEGIGEFGARPFPGVPVQGQPSTAGNRGREFIFAFPPNTDSSIGLADYRTLTLTSQVRTWATIEAPALSLVAVVEVLPGQPTVYRLPGTVDALHPNPTYPMGAISNRAVRISAPHEITVHALSDLRPATDGFLALPVERLGLEYVTGMGGFERSPQVTVVATVDGTQVSVEGTAGLSPGVSLPNYPQAPPSNFTVTMDRMQSLVIYGPPGSDLTGTRITATQPVSVLSGMECATVPASTGFCNHLIEQISPVTTLGSTFLTVPFSGRAADLFRVVANSDDTEIRIDGVLAATRDRGEFYEFQATSSQYRLVETSLPALFLQFSRGQTTDLTSFGDPSMVIVPPVSQFAHNYQVSLEANEVVEWRHFLNIVAPTTALTGLRLDGAAITATWTPIGGSTWSGASIQVARGTHSVAHTDPLVRFGLTAYGGAYTDAYSYLGELNLTPFNAGCAPAGGSAGDLVDNDCDGRVDEELANGLDDDGDTEVDEDNVYEPTSPNVAPVALAGARTLPEDVSVPIVLNAYDSNNERLIFDLVSTPTHGTLRRYGTGLSAPPEITTLTDVGPVVIYEPDAHFHGSDTFTFQVRDRQATSNVATVSLTIEDRNDPPRITSTPIATATEESAYSYPVSVADSDVGDTHTYALITAPSGMTIANTGVITWTPSNAQTGPNKVTVRVTDAAGAYDTQNFTITVANTNDPPTFSSTLPLTATRGVLMVHQVQATDPDQGDALTFQVTGPVGMRIDPKTGRLEWRPTTEASPVNFTVTLLDRAGTQVSQSRSLTLTNDTTPPQVTLSASPRFVAAGGTVTLTVEASDDIELTSRSLTVDGQGVTLNGNGVGSVVLTAVGSHTAVATAVDHANNTRTTTVLLGVTDPADTTYPVVDLTDPVDDQEITAPTVVLGTASDANLVERTLSVRRGEQGEFTVIARGTTSVTNGNLGTFDPTLLENGLYTLRLEATDANQQTSRAEITVQVQGGMKVGVFTLSFVDLQIPVSGIPITVTRTYDSRIKSREDFGVGWKLDIAAGRYEHNRRPGEGWRLEDPGVGLGLPCSQTNELLAHRTEVRLSDREWYSFRLTTVDWGIIGGGCEARVAFELIEDGSWAPGATLEILGNDYVYQFGAGEDLLDDSTFAVFDPQDVLLTTYDGRQIILNRLRGVTGIIDRNGNMLTITASGIASSAGRSISFDRDPEGRVIRVVDPLQRELNYTYDANGDLSVVEDQLGQDWSFFYGSNHLLERITRPDGVAIDTMAYGQDNRLARICNPNGSCRRFEHDLDGRLERVFDATGRRTEVEYDSEGNVVSITNGLEQRSTYEYDTNGNLVQVVDENGDATAFTWDEHKKIIQRIDPHGAGADLGNFTTSYEYNGRGQLTRLIFPGGRSVRQAFDAIGNFTELRDDNDRLLIGRTYDGNGNVTSESDGFGTTDYEVDELGQVTRITNPTLSIELGFTYDEVGNIATMIENGRESTFNYDGLDRVMSVDYGLGVNVSYDYGFGPMWSAVSGSQIPSFERNEDIQGRFVGLTRADGVGHRIGLDEAGRELAREDSLGRATLSSYDAAGRLAAVTSPRGAVMTFERDAAGRVLLERDHLGNETHYSYSSGQTSVTTTDARGAVTTFAISPDATILSAPLSRTTTVVMNGLGLATTVILPDGLEQSAIYLGETALEEGSELPVAITDESGRTREFGYSASGILEQATDRSGMETYTFTGDPSTDRTLEFPNMDFRRWEYDPVGNLVAEHHGDGSTSRMSHNEDGELGELTRPSGTTIAFSFDPSHRELMRVASTGDQVLYTWNPDDSRATMQDNQGITRYGYGADGALERIDMSNGGFIEYERDILGRISQIEFRVGGGGGTTAVDYHYDETSNIQSITVAGVGTTTFEYDLAGRLERRTLPNGVVTTFAYNVRDQLTAITHRRSDTTVLAGESYTVLALGEPGEITRFDGSRVALSYDDSAQLHVESYFDDTSTLVEATEYSYDGAGNRTSKTSSVARMYDYATAHRLQQVTIASVPVETYQFHLDGGVSRIQRDGRDLQLAYDAFDRLASVDDVATGSIVEYSYDGDGMRVRSDSPTLTRNFLVGPGPTDLDVVHAVADDAGNLVAAYVYAGVTPFLRLGPAGPVFYLEDRIGSVTALVDGAQDVIARFEYDSFGNIRSSSGAQVSAPAGTGGDFRFQGQWREEATGFYHMRARDYDPVTGRFLTRDPAQGDPLRPETFHPYLFAASNPMLFADPSGLYFDLGSLMSAQASQNNLQSLKGMATQAAKELVKEKVEGVVGELVGKAIESMLTSIVGGDLGAFAAVSNAGTPWKALEDTIYGTLCMVIPPAHQRYLWREPAVKRDGEPSRDGRRFCPGQSGSVYPAVRLSAGTYGKPDIMYTMHQPTEHRRRLGGKKGLLVGEIKISSGRLLTQWRGPQRAQFDGIVNHARHFQGAPVVMVVGFSGPKATYRTLEKWLWDRRTLPIVIGIGGK